MSSSCWSLFFFPSSKFEVGKEGLDDGGVRDDAEAEDAAGFELDVDAPLLPGGGAPGVPATAKELEAIDEGLDGRDRRELEDRSRPRMLRRLIPLDLRGAVQLDGNHVLHRRHLARREGHQKTGGALALRELDQSRLARRRRAQSAPELPQRHRQVHVVARGALHEVGLEDVLLRRHRRERHHVPVHLLGDQRKAHFLLGQPQHRTLRSLLRLTRRLLQPLHVLHDTQQHLPTIRPHLAPETHQWPLRGGCLRA
mmetsp:Transcript_38593/g.123698  ORF Transcript_38593/g.123698 Transcript_38593/m.123698 type:complete len:254 (+) Transcript_38593:260-1021(+)